METSKNLENQGLLPVNIEDEMKKSYLDYAMSVIVSRAIPDVCDGLKPVHRRILYAMNESGCYYNKPYRKSARIVGEVMGKYHPHGDSAIYDSLVRMAQNFSLRETLIDGQGNFGSVDGDSPAAMRYTESRLAKLSHSILDDLDKDTIDFKENYDGSEEEPVVLPAKFPNLLVNGAGGIAVGMATNIPTHNLGEVLDACCAYVDNHNISAEELLEIVKGPDFPTGGIILGQSGIRSAFLTGRGSVITRGKTHFEESKDKKQIIVIDELPYQVNKAKLVERIAELVKEKRIEGISDLRDESDKQGVRVVVELKKDAYGDVILNQLYTYTPLQTSFGVNMLALDRGQPKLMNLLDIIRAFVKFREEVVTRRTIYMLNKAKDKAHILIGLSIAVKNIDEVISLIRSSPDPDTAKQRLLERSWLANEVQELITLVGDTRNAVTDGHCFFTELQAKAILEMRLQRLTGLEYDKITAELAALATEITDYVDILSSRSRLLGIIKDEFLAIKEGFATPRKTSIEQSEFEQDIEDLIPKEDMVVTVTTGGYIKRTPLSTYRAQRRGGKGKSGITVRDEDVIVKIFTANTHDNVLFFSTLGKVYKLKVYKLPLASAQSKGRSLVNIFPMYEDEKINEVMILPGNEDSWDNLNIVFATDKGGIRRNSLADFKSVQSNGKIAMKLKGDDKIIGVRICHPEDHIFLAASGGRCVRFPVEAVRVFKSRDSDGVRGMRLADNDRLLSMSIISGSQFSIEERDSYLRIPLDLRLELATAEDNTLLEGKDFGLDNDKIMAMARDEEFILTITENGFAKRSSAYEYKATGRGGSGVVNIITSERNGNVVASMPINPEEQLLMITNKGTVIRCPVVDVRISGRATQGVVVFRTASNEQVVSAEKIPAEGVSEENDDIELS
ncbi:MAG: DNA topoisomerase (ATP-hydrolyzing) subunit A [Rickettsiales bacterium]|nr:DNA topoisomerase (ATP-hydrolyzing) subunit A [Rickettsiales bacterium]